MLSTYTQKHEKNIKKNILIYGEKISMVWRSSGVCECCFIYYIFLHLITLVVLLVRDSLTKSAMLFYIYIFFFFIKSKLHPHTCIHFYISYIFLYLFCSFINPPTLLNDHDRFKKQ